ncbi:GGDEF domain-containing phosphodiesterase [Fundidesulfovibrio terrae]|uniref:GGDEF domain-containing phosphodiesterase n=1 Tax=Fundidesulfovibrio terrae TaxID=2922866 RepID=UPI001FB03E4D|nr:GGDEF domain-containing phosphodiesterase [Fundidesulfovibrio terrae]
MSFSTLQRTALLLTLGFFLTMTWLGVRDSGRTDELVSHFVDRHIEAAGLLHESENALINARRIYGDLLSDRSGSVDDSLGMLDMIAVKLKREAAGEDELTAGIALDLARIRSGLVQIDEMRVQGDFSDAMGKTVAAVEQYLASARASAGQLAASTRHPGETAYFLDNALDSLSRTATRYLQARPDQLPILLNLLDKIINDTNTLLTFPDIDRLREPLRKFAGEIQAIRTNSARVHKNMLWDPNFFANTNKAEIRELRTLWDAAMLSIQSIKATEADEVRADASGIRETLRGKQRIFLMLASASLAVAVLGMLFIRSRLAARVTALMRATETLADGRLDYRVPEGPMDQFGQLAARFNSMAERLQKEENRARQALEELGRSHEALGQRVSKGSQALGEALTSLDIKDCVINRSHEGVVICDEALRIVDANPAMAQLTGYPLERLLGLTPDSFCPGIEAGDFRNRLHEALENTGSFESPMDILTRGGDSIGLRVFFANLHGEDDQPGHSIGIFRDMTPQSVARQEFHHRASRDALTGLANRDALFSELASGILRAERGGRMLAVFLLNLDNFKRLIDGQGYEAGDALLVQVARRLESHLRSGDAVARLGGDEFAVVTDRIVSDEQAKSLADRMLECFSQPFDLACGPYKASASLGLTVYPRDGSDTESLLRNASVALHRAKDTGKGKMNVFTEELDTCVRARASLERDIHDALANRDFEVRYQPIVGMNAREICGAEALLRWTVNGEPVSPAVFIPVCEEMNVMPELTRILLDKIARDAGLWAAQDLAPHVSVNICAAHFSSPGFHAFFNSELSLRGLDSSRLGIEITETTLMQDPEAARDTLRRLRNQGHQVAVDDFGTGYSSLRYLQQLPFTSLKIDRQFIMGLDSRESKAIVKATVAMAKSLGLTVVAEGVETPEQLAFLRSCGCDRFQGYLFSPAVSAEAFARMFKRALPAFDEMKAASPSPGGILH